MYNREDYDDVDVIPVTILSDHHPKARKAHDCGGCSRGIKRGERYWRRFAIVDGEPVTDKMCRECEAEMHGW